VQKYGDLYTHTHTSIDVGIGRDIDTDIHIQDRQRHRHRDRYEEILNTNTSRTPVSNKAFYFLHTGVIRRAMRCSVF